MGDDPCLTQAHKEDAIRGAGWWGGLDQHGIVQLKLIGSSSKAPLYQPVWALQPASVLFYVNSRMGSCGGGLGRKLWDLGSVTI